MWLTITSLRGPRIPSFTNIREKMASPGRIRRDIKKKKKKNVVFIYLIKILDRRPCVPMISIDISIFLREKEKKKGEMIIPYAMKSQISEGAKRIKTRSSKYIFPRQSKIRKHSEKITDRTNETDEMIVACV